MATIGEWSGAEARALRLARRMSVRAFAAHLGVATRTVSKWEHFGSRIRPRPDMQAILDTTLAQCDELARNRFEERAGGPAGDGPLVARRLPSSTEDSWLEDLERATGAVGRQDFILAELLLGRWLDACSLESLDEHALHLWARTTSLRGDVLRDQGFINGPRSATAQYTKARSVYRRLHVPRRVAQQDLGLAVLTEMDGHLQRAAGRYEVLATDERLSERDRARALLWVGTALTKEGALDHALSTMTDAADRFDRLNEPADWSVSQQKLALAYRSSGDLPTALRCLDTARRTGAGDSPMERVRLETAHGHVLLSDSATTAAGLEILDRAAATAQRYGMRHQLLSIASIRDRRNEPGRRPTERRA